MKLFFKIVWISVFVMVFGYGASWKSFKQDKTLDSELSLDIFPGAFTSGIPRCSIRISNKTTRTFALINHPYYLTVTSLGKQGQVNLCTHPTVDYAMPNVRNLLIVQPGMSVVVERKLYGLEKVDGHPVAARASILKIKNWSSILGANVVSALKNSNVMLCAPLSSKSVAKL